MTGLAETSWLNRESAGRRMARGGGGRGGRSGRRVVTLGALCLLNVLVTVCAPACSSDSGGGTTPSPPVAGSTITIATSGVTPKNLQVAPGAQVTFVNNDRRNHEMA